MSSFVVSIDGPHETPNDLFGFLLCKMHATEYKSAYRSTEVRRRPFLICAEDSHARGSSELTAAPVLRKQLGDLVDREERAVGPSR